MSEFIERRKNTSDHIENKIDDEMAIVKKQIHRFFIWGIVILAIIGLTTAISIFLFGIILKNQANQNDKIAAQSERIAHLVVTIQKQRIDFVRTGCENQNSHHDTAINALKTAAAHDIAVAKRHGVTSQGPVSVQEIRNRRRVTIGLLNFLQPKQNCDALVHQATKPVKGGPVP